jgi:hypothetical protein
MAESPRTTRGACIILPTLLYHRLHLPRHLRSTTTTNGGRSRPARLEITMDISTSTLPSLPPAPPEPDAIGRLVESCAGLLPGERPDDVFNAHGQAVDLNAMLAAIRNGLEDWAKAESTECNQAVARNQEALRDAEQQRGAFGSWRTSAEDYLRQQADIALFKAEERFPAAMDHSPNGRLVRQILERHTIPSLTPSEIRLELTRIHQSCVRLCSEIAYARARKLRTDLNTSLKTFPFEQPLDGDDRRKQSLLWIPQQAPLETRPTDASEIRNMLVGCLFGTSIAGLSQIFLAVKLAAAPVAGMMVLGFLLSKGDWNCRERDRMAAQLPFRVSETVARCQAAGIRVLRATKDEFLDRVRSALTGIEESRNRRWTEIHDRFQRQIDDANYRRDAALATARRRIDLIDRLLEKQQLQNPAPAALVTTTNERKHCSD